MARQKIYFYSHREHFPKYSGVYSDIQAVILRPIIRNPSARGILAIRHRTLPSRLDAWLLPVQGRADGRRAELADRRGPPPERAVEWPFADELQDALLLLVGQRRRHLGGRHPSLESMWIASRNSCHLRPKPLNPAKSNPYPVKRTYRQAAPPPRRLRGPSRQQPGSCSLVLTKPLK